MKKNLYTIIVPVYNSGKGLEELADRIFISFQKLNLEAELILVDDRSTDDSWNKIKLLAGKNRNIKGILLRKNYGQLSATTCGLEHASGKLFITIDDDLQFLPEEIERLITKKNDSPEALLVLGNPARKNQPFFQRLMTGILSNIFRYIIMPGYNKKDLFTSFRLIDASMLEKEGNRISGFHLYYLWEIAPRHIQCTRVSHHARNNAKKEYDRGKVIQSLMPVLYFLFQRISAGVFIIAIILTVFLFLTGNKYWHMGFAAGVFTLLDFFFFKWLIKNARKVNYEIDERTW